MPNWFDDNPYDLLRLKPNASKKAITDAGNRAMRSEKDVNRKRKISDARKRLQNTNERLLIDAFIPEFVTVEDEQTLRDELGEGENTPLPDWMALVDRTAILDADTAQLIDAMLCFSFAQVEPPTADLHSINRYDGLAEFEKELGL